MNEICQKTLLTLTSLSSKGVGFRRRLRVGTVFSLVLRESRAQWRRKLEATFVLAPILIGPILYSFTHFSLRLTLTGYGAQRKRLFGKSRFRGRILSRFLKSARAGEAEW